MVTHDFPTLAAEHVEGARLFATREDLLLGLELPPHPKIAEVGVALGTFSRFLIDRFAPSEFHAFDLFKLHEDAMLWGKPTAEVLDGKTHANFYRDSMGDSVIIHEGPSAETLKRLEDASLDLAYIDAEHTYNEVLRDAGQCARAVKTEGILVFNDYIMHDPFVRADYGIVPVVNEMVVNQGWRVIGFALQKHMFCDIAITRR